MKLTQRGFTFIEIMIVVVIISILASIAIPSYQDHIRKGKRTAAKAVLADLANRQQAYLMDNRSYASSLATLVSSFSAPPDIANDYTFAITDVATSPPSFTITATPISTMMLGDTCGTSGAVPLSIDQIGQRLPEGCWK